jgi:hypothetical protein
MSGSGYEYEYWFAASGRDCESVSRDPLSFCFFHVCAGAFRARFQCSCTTNPVAPTRHARFTGPHEAQNVFRVARTAAQTNRHADRPRGPQNADIAGVGGFRAYP